MATIQQLLAVLPNGMPMHKRDRKHAKDIARALQLPTGGNQVATRQLIRDAIQQGYIIASSPNTGYWLSSNQAEVQNCITSLNNRAMDTYLRAQELKNAWNTANPNNQIP